MGFKLLIFLVSLIQSPDLKITGCVLEADGAPIAYANIYIKDTPLGTVSNEDGCFELKIPQQHQNGTILISFIGYETKSLSIDSLKANESIVLNKSSILLDEILITKRPSTKEIVQKAFDNYYTNFPNQPYIAKGFLRHLERTPKEFKWLVEAAIEFYDPGWNKSPKDIKTNILEVRKSIDNRILDTLDIYQFYLREVKGYSFRKAFKFKKEDLKQVPKHEIQEVINSYDNFGDIHDAKRPFLFHLLSSDANKLRYYNKKKASLSKNTLFKNHRFKLDSTLIQGEHLIYKIKISPNPKIKNNAPLGLGWLYIRADDFGILEFEYSKLISKKFQELDALFGSRAISYVKLKFTDIQGKLYLKYMQFKAPKPNRFLDVLRKLKPNQTLSKEDAKNLYYFSSQELVISEIVTDLEKVENIKSSQQWNNNLFRKRPYNANFWKNYSTLLESRDEAQMRKDLENKISLKKQFEKQ